MARAVYDFQSPNRKTAIGKRREAVSREIMQFDDAMLESKLDAMIRTHPRERHNRTGRTGRSGGARVAGGFPDGNGALTPVCAGIRYITANGWSTRRYPDMPRLDNSLMETN